VIEIGECWFVWWDTKDAAKAAEAHERICVPIERARNEYIDRVCRESFERLDRYASAALDAAPEPVDAVGELLPDRAAEERDDRQREAGDREAGEPEEGEGAGREAADLDEAEEDGVR